jgi:hypothetical protein
MNIELSTVAMASTHSFWDWLFSPHGALVVLRAAGIAAFVMAVYLPLRNPRLASRYFSPILFLCVLPCILCGLAGIADYYRLDGDLLSYWSTVWNSDTVKVTIFGGFLSVIATAIYSAVFVSNRMHPEL